MLENRPPFFFIAGSELPGCLVVRSTLTGAAELEYIVDHSEMAAAVVPAPRESAMRSAALCAGREVAVVTSSLRDYRIFQRAAGQLHTDEFSECALLYTSAQRVARKVVFSANEYFVWAGPGTPGQVGFAGCTRVRDGC